MKIKYIKISNILSFKYHDNMDMAEKIEFDRNLNLIIGQNGAGKSTALEVINFVLKRIIFTQFNIDHELYSRREEINAPDRKNIINPASNNTFNGFRLDPNWNSDNQPQEVHFCVELDDIDKENIERIRRYQEAIQRLYSLYSNYTVNLDGEYESEYLLEIRLNKADKSYSVNITPSKNDVGYRYLVNYNFFKDLIDFYNYENPKDTLSQLYESFTIISGYRNYHSFNPSISLQETSASQQLQGIRNQDYLKSLNTNDAGEPAIFNVVRLRVADKHYMAYGETKNNAECLDHANNQDFLIKINEKLKIINLKVKIDFTNKQRWGYSFGIFDIKRNKEIPNINALSAGQKAIIHLVFEAYGRGDVMGGLVIIDEPELHLHYQFQNEYLRVLETINNENKCQYILVTHSDSLINSKTIHNVKRFALDANNHTTVRFPVINEDEKTLVKILDNTKSAYVFFAKKVVFVEGENDRYFFKSMIDQTNPALAQEIAIVDINGKGNLTKWKSFFESFGLFTYFIGDLDAANALIYQIGSPYKMEDDAGIQRFMSEHPDLIQRIDALYANKVFILKRGHLEKYLGIHNKGIAEMIRFCHGDLASYLQSDGEYSSELKFIINEITK